MTKHFKFTLKNISFLLILLKVGVLSAQELASKKIILIDPGHGGIDAGAIGLYNQEKDIALAMALELIKWNQILFEGVLELHLTRSSDTLIALDQRSQMAKALKPDAFISMHCNAASSAAKGIEVFVPRSLGDHTAASYHVAAAILKECHKELGFVSRGIKTANFRVLQQSVPHYPAVLVELGFITSGDEGLYFSQHKHIQAMALAILMGLVQALNF